MQKEKEIKIVTTRPPIFDNAQAAFQTDLSRMIFTYGDTIHNLTGHELPEEIIEHEKLHIKQQTEMGADIWWGKFLRDPKFRLDQEARAYAKQYMFACRNNKFMNDRNKRAIFRARLARSLSGPMYGSIITLPEADKLIRSFSGGI